MEDEEESITDANDVTTDAFSHVSTSHRESSDAIFTGENLDKLYKLFNEINNLKINNEEYAFNKTTTSDSQAILQVIQTHLPTLATKSWTKNYGDA